MPVFTPGSNTQRLPTANVSGGSYRFVHQPRQKTKTGVYCDVRASRVRTYGAGREGSRVSFNRLATAPDVRVEFESGPSRERRPVPVRTETIHRQRNDRVMPVFTPGSNTQRLPTANVSGGSHRFVRSIECRRSFRGIWRTCLTPVPRRDRHLSSRHPQNSGRLRGVLRLAFSDAVLQDGLRAKNTKAGNKLHRGVARLAR
jgi:hypothetical protein